MHLVRLACVKHAASVHPEPGSNSPLKWSQDLRPEFHEVCGSLVIRGRLAYRSYGVARVVRVRQDPQRCHSVWPFDWPSRIAIGVFHFVRSGLADRLACSHSIQFSRFRHSGILYGSGTHTVNDQFQRTADRIRAVHKRSAPACRRRSSGCGSSCSDDRIPMNQPP